METRSPKPRATTRATWSSSEAIDRERPSGYPGTFRAIWDVVARVPRGRVVTYGQVARMAGLPRGARTVGWAMRAVPGNFRIGGRPVPWHRVINAHGVISPRRRGISDDEVHVQARALRREGVRVSSNGAVDLARHLWDGRVLGSIP